MHPLPLRYIHIEYIFCIINCIYYESEEFAAHNYRNYFNKPPESVENIPLHPPTPMRASALRCCCCCCRLFCCKYLHCELY